MSDLLRGRVIKSTGLWYEVEDEQGQRWTARLRGKFKNMDLKVTNPLAVGDWVKLEALEEAGGEEQAVITEIEPRINYLIRRSIHNKHKAHILAANLDLALLIATLAQPRTSLGFIDRFLVSAEAYRIPAAIVFNKKDLLKDKGHAYLEELISTYEPLGYQCLAISAHETAGISSFRELLKGKLSLLSGHSGVGKSTLLNAVTPEANQKTAEISSFANKGTHTTTFAEMFRVEDKTWVIDTPGIKELGLVDMEEDPLDHYFPEMRALLGDCRFNNCSHTHEPGCAVMDAVEEGQIAASRYTSYLSMLSEEENHR